MIKYDDLKITDANQFEKLNSNTGDFEVDPIFTNAFTYNEQVFSGYTSFDSNYKKLKYSLGLRLEHVETKSFSETIGQKFNNSYTNFLPVIALKYMTNIKQTSNIGLSYRKGYKLPPYVQLNPFETFVNSNTIERGNPQLTQNVYHIFGLSHTINNKYFLSLNANIYNNLFQTTQIIEDDTTIISYQNLGNRYLYKADFSTTLKLYPWWRLNVNPMLRYSVLKNGRVENDVFTWNAYLTNTFTFPKSLVLNVTSLISNGESSGFDTPNSFVRINTRISLSKRFLKNKASASIGIADVFGVSNRNESNYVIDNTSFSRRAEIQSPLINFNFSYRFSSGIKVNQKIKKKSGVDSSRF